MAGKRQKQPTQLQGHRQKPEMLAISHAGSVRRVPTAPKDWHPVAKKQWRNYWSSILPSVVDVQADDDAIRRLFYCVSEREKLEEQLRKQPTVLGSTGQIVANPLFAMLKERIREIEKLREQFGLTPLHRMRLGITLDQADEARDRMEKRHQPAGPTIVEVAS